MPNAQTNPTPALPPLSPSPCTQGEGGGGGSFFSTALLSTAPLSRAPRGEDSFLRPTFSRSATYGSLSQYKSNAGGRGKPTSGPKSFSPPSCTLPPLSFSPQPSAAGNEHKPSSQSAQSDATRRLAQPRLLSPSLGRVRGSGREWWGCGGGERNRLGPYAVSLASPALHFIFAFRERCSRPFNLKKSQSSGDHIASRPRHSRRRFAILIPSFKFPSASGFRTSTALPSLTPSTCTQDQD